jgi:YDG domain
MRARSLLRFTAALQAFLLLATLFLPALAAAAVSTDQADYSPGSVVTISGDNSDGAGYLPGETVDVVVSGPNGYAASCSAVADDAGAWSCQVTLWDSLLAVGAYGYTATGDQSGVIESGTFTDASLGVAAASSGVTFSLTYQGFTSSTCLTPVGGSNGLAQTTNVTAGTNVSISFGSAAFEQLTAGAASAPSGATFASWSGPSSFSSTATTICIATPSGGSNFVYTATYATTVTTTTSISTPSITYNANGSVTVTVSSGSGTPTGNVDLSVDGGSAVSKALTAGSATFTNTDIAALASPSAGDHALSASYAAQAGFAASSGAGTLHVSKAPVTATAGSGSHAYDGSPHSPSACVVSGAYTGDLSCTNSPSSAGPGAGTTTITPVVSGTGLSNFDVTPADGSFTIGQASSTVTVDCTAGAPFTYTGSAQTPCTAKASGAGMSDVDVTASIVYGNNTNAGTASADASWGGDPNHTGNTGSSSFTIAKADAVCTVTPYTSATTTYDANPHTATGSCTGVDAGAALGGSLDLSNTTHTNAGAYASDTWSFSGGTNYNDQGPVTITDSIAKKSVAGQFTVANKIFDGDTSATILTLSLSGVIPGDSCTLIGVDATFDTPAVGTPKIVTLNDADLSGTDCGNYDLSKPVTAHASITAWDAQGRGFYEPVGVPNSVFTAAPDSAPISNPGIPWNSVKGGSTVPLKFQVFAGDVEKTNLDDIDVFNVSKLTACSGGAVTDPVEELATTGGTTLRYDGHFWIQNWKTPKVSADSCYRAWVVFADGSTLEAFFKLKK